MTFTCKFSRAEIEAILAQYHSGADRKQLCDKHGITVRTLFRWQEKAGSNRPALLDLVQHLEKENRRLRRIVADYEKKVGP